MNLTGFQPIHHSMLEKGQVYYFRNKFGSGYVKAEESNINGWTVELQKGAEFNSPSLKSYAAGHIMVIGAGEGTFYEPKG